jgi:hypothetical protein
MQPTLAHGQAVEVESLGYGPGMAGYRNGPVEYRMAQVGRRSSRKQGVGSTYGRKGMRITACDRR